MIDIDRNNYFDVAEAIHAYLILNHEGQGSKKYELLGLSKFKPGFAWSESDVEISNPYYDEVLSSTDDEIEMMLNYIDEELDEGE